MKEQMNIKVSSHTREQVAGLRKLLNLNQTEVILLAVERLCVLMTKPKNRKLIKTTKKE